MSPQFVDFNADGKLDIVAATFDGSPYVALGNDKGYQQPTTILDAKGERILLNQFWNYQTEQWDETKRCDPPDLQVPHGQCTSAVAFDWDADGDQDLLLGDHDSGVVYRRMNEGTPGEPKFASVNIPLMQGDALLVVPGTVTTPRLVDWDRDGLVDLLCGGMGDSYQDREGGGLYLYRNTGKKGAPIFEAPRILVPTSSKGTKSPERPDSGIYPDAGDFDGDGDLDLIVGGYSHWSPDARALTVEELDRVAKIDAELAEVQEIQSGHYEKMQKLAEGLEGKAAQAKYIEYQTEHQEEMSAIRAHLEKLGQERDALSPAPKREPFVWLYENTTAR